MMHLVTPELDKGPPITYCTFPIRGEPFDKHWKEIAGHPVEEIKKREGENNQLFKLIREHGLAREFPLIIATLKALSQSKVRIINGKPIDSEGITINGYDLTELVHVFSQVVKGFYRKAPFGQLSLSKLTGRRMLWEQSS